MSTEDQSFPSRESHLGETTTVLPDADSTDGMNSEGRGLNDITYFLNVYRQTGDISALRTAHMLLGSFIKVVS